MTHSAKQVDEIKVLVTPKLECEKAGITNFKFGDGEAITFKGHHENENKTDFLVTASSERGLLNRAKFLMESFLGLLEVGSRGFYTITPAGIGSTLFCVKNVQKGVERR